MPKTLLRKEGADLIATDLQADPLSSFIVSKEKDKIINFKYSPPKNINNDTYFLSVKILNKEGFITSNSASLPVELKGAGTFLETIVNDLKITSENNPDGLPSGSFLSDQNIKLSFTLKNSTKNPISGTLQGKVYNGGLLGKEVFDFNKLSDNISINPQEKREFSFSVPPLEKGAYSAGFRVFDKNNNALSENVFLQWNVSTPEDIKKVNQIMLQRQSSESNNPKYKWFSLISLLLTILIIIGFIIAFKYIWLKVIKKS